MRWKRITNIIEEIALAAPTLIRNDKPPTIAKHAARVSSRVFLFAHLRYVYCPGVGVGVGAEVEVGVGVTVAVIVAVGVGVGVLTGNGW